MERLRTALAAGPSTSSTSLRKEWQSRHGGLASLLLVDATRRAALDRPGGDHAHAVGRGVGRTIGMQHGLIGRRNGGQMVSVPNECCPLARERFGPVFGPAVTRGAAGDGGVP